MGKAGAYTACAVLARYGYGARLEAAVMAFTDARNDKPPAGMRGGLTRQGGCLYARVAVRRSSSLARLIPLSTYIYASAFLDGETTRRTGLNLDRGGQPLDTRREAGKREWHRGNSAKVARSGWLRQSSIPHDPELGAIRLKLRADSPSVINS